MTSRTELSRVLRHAMYVCVAVAALSVPAYLLAGAVTGLTSFSNGAVADATVMNANFTAVKSAVDNNHTRISSLEAGYAWCYVCNETSASTTSAAWTDVGGWADCVITTTGRPVLFNAEYSILISAVHGGMRVVMDKGTANERIFGNEATYGLDWQHGETGVWEKRSMTRVFKGIPAGTHSFRMQWRVNSNGQSFQIHAGTCSDTNLYAGSHFFMQELK